MRITPAFLLGACVLAIAACDSDSTPPPPATAAPTDFATFIRDTIEDPENVEPREINGVDFVDDQDPTQFDDLF